MVKALIYETRITIVHGLSLVHRREVLQSEGARR